MKLIYILILSITLIETKLYAKEEILESSVNNEVRKLENKNRDIFRNPIQTLSFFGIRPDDTVLEILPGKGYYSEILSLYLKEKGKFYVASFGDNHPIEPLRKIEKNYREYFNQKKSIFGNINIKDFKNISYLNGIKSNSMDKIFTFRNNHNWIYSNNIDKIYAAINRVMKKNGILGVVQHKADLYDENKKNGYIEESYLIDIIEKHGFKLISRSNINRNFSDTKDHPKGVWTLPPTLRLGEKDKEKYLAIGESDRMTLKFQKIN